MKLVLHQNFYDFFNEHRYNAEDAHLMYRMQAFDKQLVSSFRVSLCHNVCEHFTTSVQGFAEPLQHCIRPQSSVPSLYRDSELSAFLI